MRSARERLMTAEQAVASGFAAHGVKVAFDAEEAPYADLKNRVMHLKPLPEEIKKRDKEDIQGQADGEMAKLLYTDRHVSVADPLARAVFNSIESGRVEKKLGDKYFGMGENLARIEKRALKELRKRAVPGDIMNMGARAISGLSLLAKGKPMKNTVHAIGKDTSDLLSYLEECGALEGISELTSTEDAARLAGPIAERLRQASYDPPPPPPGEGEEGEGEGEEGEGQGEKGEGKGEGKGKGESQDSKGEGEGEGDGEKGQGEGEGEDGEGEGEGEGSGSDESSEGDQDGSEGSGEGSPSEAGGTSDEFHVEEHDGSTTHCENPVAGGYGASGALNLAEAAENMGVAEIRRDMVKNKKFKSADSYSWSSDYDKYTMMDGKANETVKSEFFDALKSLVPLMRRKIQMEFQAPVKSYSRHQKKGKIDGRSLWKHGLKSERLFQRRVPKPEVNADLVLLVDISGSMSGEKNFLAWQSAAAFSQVLDLIGVRHEVLAFTTCGHPEARNLFKRGYTRTEPVHHITVKPVTKSFHACADNFVNMAHGEYSMRNNVDGEAVLWAAQRLCEFLDEGAKKALVVFSDGYPAAHARGGGMSLDSHLKSVVDRVESAGIPVAGVGIHSEAVRHFYNRHVVVDELDTLGGEFLNLVRQILRENVVTR